MKRLKWAICILFFSACVNVFQSQTSPSSDVGNLPSVDPVMVTSIEIFPSVARVINGSEIPFIVVTRVGVSEVLSDFSSSIDDVSVASVLSEDHKERSILVKAIGPGKAVLTVRSGNLSATASIEVLSASP